MCGIFGLVSGRERASGIDASAVQHAMRHRGPDAYGSFLDDRGETACLFVHTRLAILDLSEAGTQPMSTLDGRFTINYNGELYNFRELRAELEARGVTFRSHCDTEVVLAAYAAWGETCVERFNGIFAFGIWDSRERSLFVARDHLGVKPLYYTTTSKSFAFASEVRTLLASGAAERRLSRDGLQSFLTFGSVVDPTTILANVFSLDAGHRATYVRGELRVDRYWSLPEGNETRDLREAVARIRHLLHAGIRRQLLADVPVGAFLSGGIDSSAVVAAASRASSGPMHTFTVAFAEDRFTEARYAAEVARFYATRHTEVTLSADDALARLDDVIAALDQPSADGINSYFVSRAAREAGLSVALSGLGGDELFAGYANFRRFERLRRFGRLAAALRMERLSGSFEALASAGRLRKLASIAAAGGDSAATYAALRAMFTAAQVRTIFPAAVATTFVGERKDGDAVRQFGVLELSNYMKNTLLRDTDVMSMAHSLEVRVPLLDRELVEYVAALPGTIRLSASMNKPLLVAAVGDLPRAATHRPKMGFTLPLESWFRGEWRDRLASVFNDIPPTLELDVSAVRQVWNDFLDRRSGITYSRVWTLAALLSWCRRHGISGME